MICITSYSNGVGMFESSWLDGKHIKRKGDTAYWFKKSSDYPTLEKRIDWESY
jgi:hypothetical protein